MKISQENYLTNAELTATNENANYKVANLINPWQRKVFKSNNSTTIITCVLTSNYDITCLAIANHNLTSCSVELFDTSSVSLGTETINTNHAVESTYCDYSSVKTIVFTCTSLVAVSIGILSVGECLTNSIESSQNIPLKSTDIITTSLDRQIFGRQGSVTREGNITIPYLTYGEREDLENCYIRTGKLIPFFLDLWDASHDIFQPIYGVFTSDLTVVHEYGYDTVSFTFQGAN